jgi:hypothetical protein
VILDAGFLISIDRGDQSARVLLAALSRSRIPLHTTHPVLAQVWRDGARQARLVSFLNAVTIHPLDDGRALGQLLALTRTSDVVDAHLVLVAVRLRDTILTGDADDLTRVADAFGAAKPTIRPWP